MSRVYNAAFQVETMSRKTHDKIAKCRYCKR
jgi:hypothetical protein